VTALPDKRKPEERVWKHYLRGPDTAKGRPPILPAEILLDDLPCCPIFLVIARIRNSCCFECGKQRKLRARRRLATD